MSLSRRALILGSTVGVAAACRPGAGASGSVVTEPEAPRQVETPRQVEEASEAVTTVSALLSADRFHIAHRGSGDNWPEHTMAAYAGAVAAGAAALEVSVCATSDGVLVCHHDRDLQRLSGDTRRIEDLTWADLQEVRIDARGWLGPAAAPEPIPRLSDVLDRFAPSVAIFIEDKQGTNTTRLLDVMDAYEDPTEHFVWKQWAGASQHRAAHERGYRTWGYFGEELLERSAELAGEFDLLGVYHRLSDDQISSVVALGTPVICWEVHDRATQERLGELGVVGMMCSNLPYVTRAVEPALSDVFGEGRRAPGDLPWTTDQGWSVQPVIDPSTRSASLSHTDLQSYRMGSMCPLASDGYRLTWEMRWPAQLPGSGEHAGIAFGQPDDSGYRPLAPSAVAGYHVILRENGSLELHAREPQQESGTLLAGVDTAGVTSGEWIQLALEVTSERILCTRQGDPSWTLTSNDTAHRGGYFSLTKNYRSSTTVQFRDVRAAAL